MENIHFADMHLLADELINNKPSYINNMVYHYTKADNIRNILQENDIHIRMTHYEDFEDKLEGKVVDVYLDLALEKLLRENKISSSTYSILIPQNSTEKDIFTFDMPESQITYAKTLSYDTYIACFCKKKNHQYMYNNYALPSGYCIGFSQIEINETIGTSFGKGFSVEYQPIMYGEEVIEFFYTTILRLISIIKKTPEKELPDKIKYLQSVLYILRKKVQYSSKLYKYSDENEVRFILKVAKEHHFSVKRPFSFGYNEKRNQRFIELTLPKYCCWEVTSQNLNQDISDYLEKNNYRIELYR